MAAQARLLGLTGWVRNRRDGTVEAMIAGDAEPVAAMLAWSHGVPPAPRSTMLWSKSAAANFLPSSSCRRLNFGTLPLSLKG
jgi:acylphosphatase